MNLRLVEPGEQVPDEAQEITAAIAALKSLEHNSLLNSTSQRATAAYRELLEMTARGAA